MEEAFLEKGLGRIAIVIVVARWLEISYFMFLVGTDLL